MAELGPPDELLADPTSSLYSLARHAGIVTDRQLGREKEE